MTQTLTQLENRGEFVRRHIGASPEQQQHMLKTVGAASLEDLTRHIVPDDIQLDIPPAVGEGATEQDALAELKIIAGLNQQFTSYIGQGYAPTILPPVILRNLLENPGWYTAYTPYQPEISQGRLEALLNFQQVTIDLTGLELASASLLDEATAAAEAMAMAKRVSKKKNANRFFIADDVHPQTLDVIRTRAEYFGFELIIDSAEKALDYDDVFGVLLQQTGTGGQIHDYRELLAQLHQRQVITSVAADIMALVLLEAPANRARISSSAQPSVLVCRWATAALMLPSLPAVMLTNVRCRAVLSGYPLMPPVTVLCVWRCKPANSISAVKKRTPISVPLRFCWQISPGCMRSTTGRKV